MSSSDGSSMGESLEIRINPELVARLRRTENERPADRAYDGIREAILTGVLKPGEHLREEQLATMTGTSRTPVREALRRLVAEGLATAENRHRFVTDFSYEEVVIVFELRAKVESYAAGVAAAKITDEELKRLERIIHHIDQIDPAGGVDAVHRFITLNSDFHGTIVQSTRSRQLKLMTAQAISLPLVLIKQFVWDQSINIARSNAQHRDILAALSQRNAEWAATAMAAHILSTKPRPRSAQPSG
ncbi:MAG TPA: GntR family transcriptional regulator [Rhizobiaceae bacterium]|nr:GntR family transcriptional regulator [Rhizobiaceae bacterium]